MIFLVLLSALLVAPLAAPAKLFSPQLLQDLAYKSLDLDMDGKPDEAITIGHPAPYAHAAPAAYQAPSKVHYAPAQFVYGHSYVKPTPHAPLAPWAPWAPYYTIRAPWYKEW